MALPVRTLSSGPTSNPDLRSSFHVSYCVTKGEDVSIVRKPLLPSGLALYAVADGHNGSQAAKAVLALLEGELLRQLGAAALPSPLAVRAALARTFLALNDAICSKYTQSGCTLTAAVVSPGGILTVANCGDSGAILDMGAEVVQLTQEHRIGASPTELARLEAAGGRLARLNEYGAGPSRGVHDGVGPVRLWPGGIMVARAIGDRDIGDILIARPHIHQLQLPPTGARLIIASDGLWDAMPAARVARVLRGHPTPKAAANQAVSGVAASMGGLLRDDITVVVADFLPESCQNFGDVCKKFQGRLRGVLSDPQLSNLAMDPPAGSAPRPNDDEQPAKAPRRGLFACFARPAVKLADPEWSHNGSVRSVHERGKRSASARGGSSRSCAGLAERGSRSVHAGLSSSLGGSERSVRSGAPRDPSVRSGRRATSVQLIYEGDSALWTPAELGRAPSLGQAGSTRSSNGSVHRASPRSLADGLYSLLGHSVASMTSEEDVVEVAPQRSPRLVRALSVQISPAEPLRRADIARKNSAPVGSEKKCRGGTAAASLLQQV
ncbi:hypothetical protein ABPG77_009095 [Micractinium sp. CCAP 211/92]